MGTPWLALDKCGQCLLVGADNVVSEGRLRGWGNIQNQLLVHVSYNSIQLGIFLHPMARLMTKKTVTSQTPLTYRDAGVDIDTGEALVQRIKPLVERTMRPGVLSSLGGFGALFEIPAGYRQPVLVSGTDGVGTKLRLAFDWQRHRTVGIDLVAMSVNDILVQGAEPLYFLDYFACGVLALDTATEVIAGIAQGCEQAGCALIGGETAEMPGMYPEGEYDLAGFAVGIVEKDQIIDGQTIQAGDRLLGLASSGPHSNGYSLIRKVLERTQAQPDDQLEGQKLVDLLMAPTRIYVPSILSALRVYPGQIKGMAHITGGGLSENIPRILPAGLGVQLEAQAWSMPKVFQWLQEQGQISDEEMWRVFNCGIGMVLIADPQQADNLADYLAGQGETVYQLGEVIPAPQGQPRFQRRSA